MIHYHGGPFGSPAGSAAKFYAGKHAMVSFAYPQELAVIAEVSQSFALDNGAFTEWKRGNPLDVEGYFEFVEKWHRHPGFDWALIPDVIDGGEDENDALLAQWPNAFRLVGVPVWHLHESLDRLVRLSQEWPRVALGSSGEYATPGTRKWWHRMGEALAAITDDLGRPLCKLHGLRMLDPRVFTQLPLASADSTNAVINCKYLQRFGAYRPPSKVQAAEVIAARVESQQSAPVWVKLAQEEMVL